MSLRLDHVSDRSTVDAPFYGTCVAQLSLRAANIRGHSAMSSNSIGHDRSEVPPRTEEPSSFASQSGGLGAEWPRLLARVVEGIVRAELHQFEENVMALLNSAVADAYAGLVWLCARFIGVRLLLTALILFLGVFLQWWEVFALAGLGTIALGSYRSPVSDRQN